MSSPEAPSRSLAMHGPVDDYGYDPRYEANVRGGIDFLYDRWFRVESSGADQVPESGPLILVANHGGTLPWDWLMLQAAVHRESSHGRLVRPLLEDEVFHLPFVGAAARRLGAARACQQNAMRLLSQDAAAVAVFPEGFRALAKGWEQRYQLQRFGRGGFVKLALRSGAQLQPVAIVGAEETAPLFARLGGFARPPGLPFLPVTPTFPLLGPAGLLPLPSKWMIRFGAPVQLEGGAEAAEDRRFVGKCAEDLRAQIQTMVSELRQARGPAFRLPMALRR